ncbi:DUF7507 domain-containing protein [Sphingobacterium bambusae]|uniref:Gliding motility-associated C-terminal domain-containing protein n=1 Tax=Sphingobacterium bambusae TaxID=662858 RepID=A0ABW6BCN1_9SPHI|nr:gliding motility-associated C-terminal domain-containing protein [Sphingobacterium bambusae]WPL46867.1 gliding motility-associated C-terminal domain-containing protein [Sphingobacterium bambusae]
MMCTIQRVGSFFGGKLTLISALVLLYTLLWSLPSSAAIPAATSVQQSADVRFTRITDRSRVYTKVGDVIEYTVSLANRGPGAISSLVLTHSKAENTQPISLPNIDVNGQRTFIISYSISQADIDRGAVYAESVLTGRYADNSSFTLRSVDTAPLDPSSPGTPAADPSCLNCTVIPIVQSPKLQVVMSTDRSRRYTKAGELINYVISVRNTGNTSLQQLRVHSKDAANTLLGQAVSLAVNQTLTFSSSHSITQADIDRGVVYQQVQASASSNGKAISQASVDGNPLGTTDPLRSPDCPDCTVAPIQREYKLNLVKSIDRSKTYQQIGDELLYQITLTNAGNVTLSNVQVSDNNATLQGSGSFASLLAGETQVLQAKRSVTQADIDRGAVYNQASVTAKDPEGNSLSTISIDTNPLLPADPLYDATCPSCTVVPIVQSPLLSMVKTTDRSQQLQKVGDVAQFSIRVKNSGNVPLYQVSITDPSADNRTVGSIALLAIGEERSFTASHSITQADIDRGAIYNVAAGTARTVKGVQISSLSTDGNPLPSTDLLYDPACAHCTVIAVQQQTQVQLHKTTDHSLVYSKAGDVIEYTVVVRNTGNTTLSNLQLSGVRGEQRSIGSIAVLAAGATRSFRTSHVVTQAELDRGAVYNLAQVKAVDPKGREIVQTSTDPQPQTELPVDPDCPDCTIVRLSQQPGMQLLETADKTLPYNKVGDIVSYTITLRNSGNQTLRDIVLSNEKLQLADAGTLAQLEVGQSHRFEGSHVVTQADLDRGAVYTQSSAKALDPKGSSWERLSEDGDPLGALDPLLDPACAGCTVAPMQQLPKTAFIKSYNRTEVYNQLGQQINYTIRVTNTGNVTLQDVRLSDTNADMQDLGSIAQLAVGETRSFSATHSITAADIQQGVVYNQALLKAVYGSLPYEQTSVDSQPLSSDHPLFDPACPSCTVTPVGYLDRLVLQKTADRSQTYSKVGDVISYSLDVRKEGNRSVNNLVITDANADDTYVGSVSSLAVGESRQFTAKHTVTQADLDSGAVYNQAVAWARDTDGNLLESLSVDGSPLPEINDWFDPNCPNCTITLLQQNPALRLLKTTDRTQVYKQVGDVIMYWLIMTNTGNVTLFNIQLTDANADDSAVGRVSRLEVGQTRTFLAYHTITQADVDRGAVYNIALAQGQDPRGKSVEAQSEDNNPLDPNDPTNPEPHPDCPSCTITPVQQEPAISLTKTSDRSQRYNKPGDVIRYTLTVTNSGNTTLKNIRISDALADVPEVGLIAQLEVGQSQSFTATHTVTQADVDQGAVYNIAYAKGEDPAGRPVEAHSTDSNPLDPNDPETPEPQPGCPDCTVTPIDQREGLRIIKTVDLSQPFRYAGERLAYRIAVSNVGNVTLRNIVVSDANADNPQVGNIAELAVGQTVELTAYHTITQADMERGYVANIAHGVGQNPQGEPVTEDSESGNTPQPGDPTDPACPRCTIAPLPWKKLEAIDDYFRGINGRTGSTTETVLLNDKLENVAVVAAELLLTPGTAPAAGIAMQANGRILVSPAVAAGSYSYPYRICEVKNPSNCAQAVAYIEVLATLIEAADDTYTVNGKVGGTTASIFVNDKLHQQVIVRQDIALHSVHTEVAALQIQADGSIRIAAGTVAGLYELPYRICEVLNPSNCASAVARVQVQMAPILAEDDRFLPIIGAEGAVTASVLQNDKLNQVTLLPADVRLSWLDEAPVGLELRADGSIVVQAQQPAASYQLRYRICELLNPSNCSEATAYIEIVPTPILARDERIAISWSRESQQTISVLDNDLLNGKAIVLEDITLYPGIPSDAGLSMNRDGSILIPSGLRPGSYSFPYRICEVLNPSNCAQAVATIEISSELFIPNIFTPGKNDGINDTFEIIGHKQFDRIKLVVINRWGNEVYKNDQYNNDWNGSNLPEGTYYYHITTFKGSETQVLKGWVMIK